MFLPYLLVITFILFFIIGLVGSNKIYPAVTSLYKSDVEPTLVIKLDSTSAFHINAPYPEPVTSAVPFPPILPIPPAAVNCHCSTNSVELVFKIKL
jgi:hypothetical protein